MIVRNTYSYIRPGVNFIAYTCVYILLFVCLCVCAHYIYPSPSLRKHDSAYNYCYYYYCNNIRNVNNLLYYVKTHNPKRVIWLMAYGRGK